MRKTNLPIVDDVAFNYSIFVGSDGWFDWLKITKSFRYIPRQWSRTRVLFPITIRNRSQGYWYAYRKVNNRLRQFYVGKTQDLDWERIQLAVEFLSQTDREFYQSSRSRRAVVQK